MFGIITVEKEQKKSRLLRRKKCRIEVNNTAVIGGAPFRHIRVFPGRKGIDWKGVERAAGCAAESIITQVDTVLPKGTYLKRFEADTLPLLLMLNTAAGRLDRGENAKKRTLLIIDENAVLPQYIERIVLCAYKIRIVTSKPEKYYSACAHLLENYGASPIVCSSTKGNESFDVCIAENEYEYAKINFTADKTGAQGYMCKIPDEYLRLCPDGVDAFLFLCALFECGGVSVIGNLSLE